MNESKKYCRSLHSPISLGTTSDDRIMPKGYLGFFYLMDGHVLTEKLDGQNDCMSRYGLFARSHTSPTQHPWDKPLRERWELIKNDLKDLEIFGENMYGQHSIGYNNLESYYYVFAVREHGVWLSWEEVKFYAAMLDFPTVPEIEIKVPLKDLYKNDVDENEILRQWFVANLGMTWEEYTNTSGALGGFDVQSGKPASEGFVIRNSKGFKTNEGDLQVSSNEFNNLFKVVREAHVNTDEHWTKNWKPAKLIDYSKYNWHSYEFLNLKK